MTPEETAWLAGLLEGEGCFAMGSGVQVILAMTDEDIVRRAAVLMGDTRVTVRDRAPYKPQWKSVAYGTEAERVMRAIRPYLGSRRGAKVDALLAARALQGQPVATACAQCWAAFTRGPAGRGLGSPRRYCTPSCKSAAAYARKRAARQSERTTP